MCRVCVDIYSLCSVLVLSRLGQIGSSPRFCAMFAFSSKCRVDLYVICVYVLNVAFHYPVCVHCRHVIENPSPTSQSGRYRPSLCLPGPCSAQFYPGGKSEYLRRAIWPMLLSCGCAAGVLTNLSSIALSPLAVTSVPPLTLSFLSSYRRYLLGVTRKDLGKHASALARLHAGTLHPLAFRPLLYPSAKLPRAPDVLRAPGDVSMMPPLMMEWRWMMKVRSRRPRG